MNEDLYYQPEGQEDKRTARMILSSIFDAFAKLLGYLAVLLIGVFIGMGIGIFLNG